MSGEAPEILRRLTAGLHAQIPMTEHLGIRLVELEADRIVLAAPLAPSRNHRATAFGPGVFTAAGLAPWILLVRRAWAARLPVQILLGRCELVLHRPITGDFVARSEAPPVIDAAALERGEKVRISAEAHVGFDAGPPAATYRARYAIVPAPAGAPAGDLPLPFPEAWRS